MGALGYVITFVPGAECPWFAIVAGLSIFGLLIPKILYRITAAILCAASIIFAVSGHERGAEYDRLLATHYAGRNKQGTVIRLDPFSRFVTDYTTREGSFVYHSTGISSSADPQEAIAKLCKTGVPQPPLTNLSVIEVRQLHPQDERVARSLTNHVAALVETEAGQRIILLRPISGEWWYHVYNSN